MTKILQLKISLYGIKPEIWRRFLVEDNISFDRLHKIIQTIMGWENYHLYDFNVNENRLSIPDDDWEADIIDSRKVKLKILKPKQKFDYTYDFGDCWEHSLVIEKILEKDNSKKYPICLEGERACPPEDCGSVPGYYNLMKIRKNKRHPEYKRLIVEWLGEDYDPEFFIVDWINSRLHGKRPSPIWVYKKNEDSKLKE